MERAGRQRGSRGFSVGEDVHANHEGTAADQSPAGWYGARRRGRNQHRDSRHARVGSRRGGGYPGGGYPGAEQARRDEDNEPPKVKAHDNDALTIDDKHYAIAGYGVPDRMLAGERKKLADELKRSASIKRDGKKDFKPLQCGSCRSLRWPGDFLFISDDDGTREAGPARRVQCRYGTSRTSSMPVWDVSN
jgi:hypothetical protein